jgi:hypothetical protein
MASASHKYSVGQMVSFSPGSGSPSHFRGSYTIMRLLPGETQDWQYRVKCDHDAHERVVPESQRGATLVKSPLSDPRAVSR